MRRVLLPCTTVAGVLFAVLAGPLPANADAVHAVTVYPDRATVTREHRAPVTAGEGIVRIEPLPVRIDVANLRVRAEGPEGLVITHVETRTVHGRELAHPDERALADALQAARDERRMLADGRQAQAMKLSFIERLVENAGAVEPGLPPDQWHRAWGLVSEGALDTLEQIARIDQALREIDSEISRLERELNALRTGRRESIEVGVHYQSAREGEARITLEYDVPDASWSPVYEARLDTAVGQIEIVQRAEVRQNTGEEWSNVTLHLSTTRPALGGRLPELQPWFLDTRPPPRAMMRKDAAVAEMLSAPAPAPMLEAVLETTGFAATYRVAGRVSVPADNRQQRFLLASHSQNAALSGRAVPAQTPHVYLFAEASFAGEAPLLPGPVTLFQDAALVGATRISGLAPGAPLRLAFGVDDRVEVRREIDRDRVGREGLIRRQQRLERAYRITVTNRHTRGLTVTVLDRLPVPRDDRVKVDLHTASTPPSETDVDGRPGVLAWTSELGAGESRDLHFGYVVSWPDDMEPPQGL